MFYSPYETTACQGYGRTLKAVVTAVKHAKLRDELITLGETSLGVTAKTDDCPLFTQPLTPIETLTPELGNVFDVRPYTRLEGRGDDTTAVVTSRVAIDVLELRSKIQLAWFSQRADLINVGDHPVLTFVNYVGRNISIRLGLNPGEELKLYGLLAYYYFCLFYTEDEFISDVQHRCLYRASKLTRVPYEVLSEMVEGALETGFYIPNVEALIRIIRTRIDSPRVRDFNLPLLYALVGGGWYGPNRQENLCVALEHPPTWLWMVKEAVGNQSYRRTLLGKVAIEQDRKGSGTQFLKSLKLIIGG